MTETDLSDWLTVEEAAQVIGVSTRTVERLGHAKKLERRPRRQEGTPPVAVYNPDDVDRIARERRPEAAPFVLPRMPDTHGNGRRGQGAGAVSIDTEALSVPAGDDPIRQLFAAALRAVLSPPSPPVSERIGGEHLYLTLPEAAAWTGLTEAYLRRKCRDGSLKAIKDHGWKMRRTDLETL